MYHPVTIANHFILESFRRADSLRSMKLQGLVYIAHGWCLGITGKPLINEEALVWKYGPVIASLYQLTKKYDKKEITEIIEMDGINLLLSEEDDRETIDFLNAVWKKYRDYKSSRLSNLVRLNNSPWHVALVGGRRTVSDNLMEDYYKDGLIDDTPNNNRQLSLTYSTKG